MPVALSQGDEDQPAERRDLMTPFGRVDTTQLLVEGMKVAQFNQRLIANNIANADTPNYNPARLDFQRTLQRAVEGVGTFQLRKSDPRHLDSVRIRPSMDRSVLLSKNDTNKVDLDEEMVRLSENTGRFTTYGDFLITRFQSIKSMLQDLR
jgi:flagellar basal-body rod protein FlgB